MHRQGLKGSTRPVYLQAGFKPDKILLKLTKHSVVDSQLLIVIFHKHIHFFVI